MPCNLLLFSVSILCLCYRFVAGPLVLSNSSGLVFLHVCHHASIALYYIYNIEFYSLYYIIFFRSKSIE